MHIAFDLDDTLVPCGHALPTERPTGLRGALQSEQLRRGSGKLLRNLAGAGHVLSVYTSSERSRWTVAMNFWRYGIRLARVVNRRIHDDWWRTSQYELRERLGRCEKYPPAFGFDLLVDDSIAVADFGRVHGFAVARIDPADDDWVDSVRRVVDR